MNLSRRSFLKTLTYSAGGIAMFPAVHLADKILSPVMPAPPIGYQIVRHLGGDVYKAVKAGMLDFKGSSEDDDWDYMYSGRWDTHGLRRPRVLSDGGYFLKVDGDPDYHHILTHSDGPIRSQVKML